MFWRTFIFAFLAVGALAVKFEIIEANKNLIKTVTTSVCKKAGGGDAEEMTKHVTSSLESFLHCVSLLVDFQTLISEFEAAKLNGAIGEVSKKYCAKTPELKTCFHTLIDAASPCVESAESQLSLAKNSTDHIIDYVCYNDGNRITQFLTDNGTECVLSKGKEICEIHKCFSPHIDNPLENLLSLTTIEKCRIFDGQTACVLRSLKTCTPPTPGYLLESLVRYVRKESVCNDALPLKATTGTTILITDTSATSPTAKRTTSLTATRTTLPAATRTTLPAATRMTSPAATKITWPTFLLTVSLNGTFRVEFP